MGGRQFKFTPKVEDEGESTQVKDCNLTGKNLTLSFQVVCSVTRGEEQISSHSLDVVVVFPPQPFEEVLPTNYITVQTHKAVAKASQQANCAFL